MEADRSCRTTLPATNSGERFLRRRGEETSYSQFNSVYIARLNQMRPALHAAASCRWNGISLSYMDRIIDCETLEGEECVLMGTLYKEMSLKPSVLDEFKDFAGVNTVVSPVENYTSPGDFLLLEDDSGRVRLKGLEDFLGDFVTGVMIAVRGFIDEAGMFQVNRRVFHEFNHFRASHSQTV